MMVVMPVNIHNMYTVPMYYLYVLSIIETYIPFVTIIINDWYYIVFVITTTLAPNDKVDWQLSCDFHA